MSHNFPYRKPLSDSDLRPDPGAYSSSGRRVSSPDCDFYRPPKDFLSSSYPSSSRAQRSQDGSLNILSSCGLEPGDLALLAELPEDVLTVESLPQVLKQLKVKRGTVKPFAPSTPSSPSYSHSSARRPAPGSSSSDRDQTCSRPLQYPRGRAKPGPLLLDLDHWGNPRTCSSTSTGSASSSSSSYVVDYHHGPGSSEHGKTDRDAAPVSSQDRASFSSSGGANRTRPSRFSEPTSADYRSVASPDNSHPETRGGRHEPHALSIRSSTQLAAPSVPSQKEAVDFQGKPPMAYPYSCSLCETTVMSERVWNKHINGNHHANGLLRLLQRFPDWDCRMEAASRVDSQPERWKEGHPQQAQTANQSSALQTTKAAQKKTVEKSKVVCVKFPAQSVDETYLRKLTEPFGKIIKILMFPSLAFVELGSVDQAKDLVKFHANHPPMVNGEPMVFQMSHTFSFLQSSRVVNFSPAPFGKNGRSDLMSIVKRFGSPLYTLFLPSMAFVEMKDTPEAQKLVDYYSSNSLRINNDTIKVSFSGEYKSLMRVPSAKKYEEETSSPKRTRSSSRENEDKRKERKKRRSSKEREEGGESKTRGRPESKQKATKEKTTSSRDKFSKDESTRSRSQSREKSTKEKTTRSSSREKSRKAERTKSRSKSPEKNSRDKKTRARSRSREKSIREEKSRSKDTCGRDKRTRARSKSRDLCSRGVKSRSKSRSRGKSVVPEKTEATASVSRTDPEAAPVGACRREAEEPSEEELSAESDIEGMEVIGEDGENLEDEDMETLDEAEKEEEEDEMEEATGRTDSPEEGKEEGVKDGEKAEEKPETQLEDTEEETDFPVDPENCITLDELEEDQSDDKGDSIENKLTDTSSEPSSKPLTAKQGLGEDSGGEKSSESSRTSEGTKQSSKAPEKELKKTPTKELETNINKSASRSSPEEVSSGRKSPEKPRKSSRTTTESASKKTSKNEMACKKTSEKDSKRESEQAEEQLNLSKTSPENEKLKRRETCVTALEPDKRREPMSDSKQDLGIHKEETSQEAATDSEVQVEQQSGAAGGAAKLQKPTKPVGTEFVRPVVGYFCNLCQVIYADEDEAKMQHCRSPTHYRKYREKMGKDPWTS